VDLARVVYDIADALVAIDSSRACFKTFQPGVGPYGEPQLVRALTQQLNQLAPYKGLIATKRLPDLFIKSHWAVEFKIARPFGDNGRPAENWSVNLLHPFEGNVSAIGDCLRLLRLDLPERKALVVVGYEHTPPRIVLAPLLHAFEVVAEHVASVRLSEQVRVVRLGIIHPVHQQLTVAGWEVLGRIPKRQT
jgi:hypothetical protein